MAKSLNSIMEVVDRITAKNGAPCKKSLQKIVYLIEQKGANLGFDYGIHFYGPYSAALDYSVQQLCSDGLLKIEYTDGGHIISKTKSVSSASSANYLKIVDNVVNEFANDTPSDLELISTTLFVATNLDSKEKKDIISGVEKIKGSKYSKDQINAAIGRLVENQFFTVN